ncbi:hypothetical protein N9Y35_00825, partial [Flavobacteriales bacterium]|nr:hypothetical protein [Flavobacteriales bacterium]
EQYLDVNFLNIKTNGGSGTSFSKSNYKTNVPSRFNQSAKKKEKTPIKEVFIPKNLKKLNPNLQARNYKEQSYSTGMKVEHERFGTGIICNLEGAGANKKISINFTEVGEKTLLAKFAKLTILS